MRMKSADIQNAFTTALDVAGLGYPIVWENIDLDPARPFLEAQIVRTISVDDTLDGSGEYQEGYFYVSVVSKTDKFATPALDIADEIATIFPYGWAVAIPNGVVTVNRPPLIGTGYPDGSDFRVPVKLFYEANASY